MLVKTIGSAEAALWFGVSRGRFQTLLRQRRIRGARFVERAWRIPVNFAVTPATRGPKLRKGRPSGR